MSRHIIEFRERGLWTCPECGFEVFSEAGVTQLHTCPPRLSQLDTAKGFENGVPMLRDEHRHHHEQPEIVRADPPGWLEQAGPSTDTRERIKRHTSGSDLKIEIIVEWRDGRLYRAVAVRDPNLPEHLRTQERELSHLEDWEPVLRELGLIP